MNSYSVVVVALTIHAHTIVVNFTASTVPSPELSLARGFDLHGRSMASSYIDLLIVELFFHRLSYKHYSLRRLHMFLIGFETV